jgi:hypothetical protein
MVCDIDSKLAKTKVFFLDFTDLIELYLETQMIIAKMHFFSQIHNFEPMTSL